jgi:hypothetical protein
MQRFVMVFLGMLFFATLGYGQDSLVAPSQEAVAIAHGAFPARVTKTLDSSKLKEDDSIEVETAGSFKLSDGTLVPKGSKMMGRVVTAKARSKGDPDSELTLAFNKLNIQGGKVLALKGMVQAVYPPAEEPTGPNMATMGTSGGGAMRGASGDATGLTNTRTGMDTQAPSTAQLVVDTKAIGVQGMYDLSLDKGVMTSKGKNVKLGTGVRLLVRVDIFG